MPIIFKIIGTVFLLMTSLIILDVMAMDHGLNKLHNFIDPFVEGVVSIFENSKYVFEILVIVLIIYFMWTV